MWAVGRLEFGLSESEFWHLSPRQWNALMERRRKNAEAEDRRAALICCIIANVHRPPKIKEYKVSDFMPNYDMPRENAGLSPEQMLDKVTIINRILGGADMRDGDMRQ